MNAFILQNQLSDSSAVFTFPVFYYCANECYSDEIAFYIQTNDLTNSVSLCNYFLGHISDDHVTKQTWTTEYWAMRFVDLDSHHVNLGQQITPSVLMRVLGAIFFHGPDAVTTGHPSTVM